ncbi:MAG: type III toxin-antitoxin system ToxN/AbiQ family toxin [Lachnospiraceae bacterium]
MDFYRINEKYIQFLQRYEKEKRGVTKVPDIRYTDRNKFAFGAVMRVNGINYYVSVSSFDRKQEANILIRVPGDKKEVKGSLRFNYMVPVPDECIEKLVIKDVEDEKYRLLLNKEYQFCMNNADRIQKKANKIYEMVTTNCKQILTDNSCAFKILEVGYHEYSYSSAMPNCNASSHEKSLRDGLMHLNHYAFLRTLQRSAKS